MTKTRTVLLVLSLVIALTLIGGAVWLWDGTDHTILHGTAVIEDGYAYLLTSSDELVWLSEADDALLAGVQTGDILAVTQKTNADGDAVITDCVRLAGENHEAVAASPAVNALKGERVSYSYGYAGVALNIPDGWCYEEKPYTKEGDSFGILFWPEGHGSSHGSHISVCYDPQFGVCGTGLQCEDAVIGGYNATIGTYMDVDSAGFFFITFEGTPGTYVVTTLRTDGWWKAYGEQAMAILNTVGFAPDAPPLLSEEEAITRAQDSCTVETYHNLYAKFDHLGGCWEVHFVDEHYRTIETVSVSALDLVVPDNWGPW